LAATAPVPFSSEKLGDTSICPEEFMMKKYSLNPRQVTIIRLREFLQKSLNLEPELERFVKTLIISLEKADHVNPAYNPCSSDRIEKVLH